MLYSSLLTEIAGDKCIMKVNSISTQPGFAGIYQVKVNSRDVSAFERNIAPLYKVYKEDAIKAFYRGREFLYVFTGNDASKFNQEWKPFQQSYLADSLGQIDQKVIQYGTGFQNRSFGEYISAKTVEAIPNMKGLMSKLLG